MEARWIWENDAPGKDEYAVFYAQFRTECTERILLNISADSRYEAYVNGTLAGFGQYADYPHYKVADRLDIGFACKKDINELKIIVWYYGEGSLCYQAGKAGLFFEVREGERLLCCSGTDTLCAKEPHYQSGRCKKITSQLGYGFRYDADGSGEVLHPAVPTGYETRLYPRPIADLQTLPLRKGNLIKTENGGRTLLLDLGCEEVGLLSLEFESDVRQTVTVAWGEHIADGLVRARIGGRDFTVEYVASCGRNHYINYMRRFGARYLELHCEQPVSGLTAGLIPVMYPVKEKPFDAGNPVRQAVYDVCVRTLRLCMHEHYEDCPWREQALYALDSRNQMLAGYYAFGETHFPRACLALIAQDRREDGLLSITSPCGDDLAIPSFSLHWYTEMREYAEYSGDVSLIRESWKKLCSVLEVFLKREREGVIMAFTDCRHWNFYEWSEGLEGSLRNAEAEHADLPLNSLVILAVESLGAMAKLSGCVMPFDAEKTAADLRRAAHARFMRENGLLRDFDGREGSSQLGLSLAILSGIADSEEARSWAELLVKDTERSGLTGITLSMKCFLYDALLKVDTAYRSFVLADIERVYKHMLEEGATSVWETEKGQADFDNAGSLCHGWSAMPVYYYHKLL